MTTKGYTVLAFVLGGVVGAGVALLLAPASGEVTRKRIKDGATDAADRLTEKYEDVKETVEVTRKRIKDGASDAADRLTERYEAVKETVAENAGKVKQMFEDKKEELKAVYEAGRETYIKGK